MAETSLSKDRRSSLTGGILYSLKEFGQGTTWHGMKQIAESGSTTRKFCWLAVVVIAFTVFFYAVGNDLVRYYEYNSRIEVVKSHEESLPFPRVTLCNTNPYKLSNVVKMGLYDTLVDATKAATSGETQTESNCAEHFAYNSSLCFDPYDAVYSYTYLEVSSNVCSQLCIHLEPNRCAGYLYNTQTRECVLSSATMPVAESCQKRNRTKYYIRKRFAEPAEIKCNYEEGNIDGESKCGMASSAEEKDIFILTEGNDHTLQNGRGHFLYMLGNHNLHGLHARIESSFVYLSNTCLQLFYTKEAYGRLNIYIRAQNLSEILLKSIGCCDDIQAWTPLFVEINVYGTYQIVIDGSRFIPQNHNENLLSGIGLDDIRIMPCSLFEQDKCRVTLKGDEYLGTQSVSSSGKECLHWNELSNGTMDSEFYFQRPSDFSGNYCRSPSSDSSSPWCFVNISGKFETCDVPVCPCQDDWFQCNNGYLCLPAQLACDGKWDCQDNSDEICPDLTTFDCDFDSSYVCGYYLFGSSGLHWKRVEQYISGRKGSAFSMHLDSATAVNKHQAYMITPYRTFAKLGAVGFYLHFDKGPKDRGIHVTVQLILENGSFGDILSLHMIESNLYLVCVPAGTYALLFKAFADVTKNSNVILDSVKSYIKGDRIGSSSVDKHCEDSLMDLDVQIIDSYTNLNCSFDHGLCYKLDSLETTARLNWNLAARDIIHRNLTAPEIDACNATHLQPTSGIIRSPNYPEEYSYGLDCFITITNDYNDLTLEFLDFRLEPFCFDYLEVFDALNPYNAALKMCGTKPSFNYTSNFSSTVIHFHTDDKVALRGYEIKFQVSGKHNTDKAYGLSYSKRVAGLAAKNILLLPSLLLAQEHCLTLDIFARQSTSIYRTSDMNRLENERLVSTYFTNAQIYGSKDKWLSGFSGLGLAWHNVKISLSASNGQYTLISVVTDVGEESQFFITGIDNIMLYPEACSSLDYNGSADCNFSDIQQCGFVDISKGQYKWIRGYNSQMDEYRLFVILKHRVQDTAQLLTPEIHVREKSCFNIALMPSGERVHILISKYRLSGAPVLLQTRSFSVLDSIDEPVTIGVDLNPGQYRLLIEAKGFHSSVSISHVFVSSNRCSSDGNKTAPRAVERKPKTTNLSMVSAYSFNPASEMPVHDHKFAADTILNDLINDQDGEDLAAFVVGAAPTKEQTILKCTWDEGNCDKTMVTEAVTEMGQCFVFNSNQSIPVTIEACTCVEKGKMKSLRLLLNVGKFDLIEETSTSSGFKVLVDHGDDIQRMRNNGFGVRAGTKTFIKLNYHEKQFEKPPWGSCGEKDLPYYANNTYTYNRCSQACDILKLVQRCSCGEAFMRGEVLACHLKTYLDCALPAHHMEDVVSSTLCPACVSQCDMIGYDPLLSSEDLSISILSILTVEQHDSIILSYKEAMELRQRVSPKNMLSRLHSVRNLQYVLVKFEEYINYIVLDSRTSALARAEQAFDLIYSGLLNTYLNFRLLVHEKDRYYNKNLGALYDNLAKEFEKTRAECIGAKMMYNILSKQFTNDSLYFEDCIYTNDDIPCISLKNCMFHFKRLHFHVKAFNSELGDIFKVNIKSFLQYIVSPASKYRDCKALLRRLLSGDACHLIGKLEQAAKSCARWNGTFDETHIRKTYNILDDIVQTLIYFDAEGCFLNYKTFSLSLQRRNLFGEPSIIPYGTRYNVANILTNISSIIVSIEKVYDGFAKSSIDGYQLFESFSKMNAQIENAISDLNARVNQHLIVPFKKELAEAKMHVIDDINNFFEIMLRFSQYQPDNNGQIKNLAAGLAVLHFPVVDYNKEELIIQSRSSNWLRDIHRNDSDWITNYLTESVIERSLEGFFSSITSVLQDTSRRILSQTNEVKHALTQVLENLSVFNSLSISTDKFVRDNILQLDVFYGDLSKTVMMQKQDYDLLTFFGSLGGYMGLFVGASIISVAEVIDWFLLNCLLRKWTVSVTQSRRRSSTNVGQTRERGENVNHACQIVKPFLVRQSVSSIPAQNVTTHSGEGEVQHEEIGNTSDPSHRVSAGMQMDLTQL